MDSRHHQLSEYDTPINETLQAFFDHSMRRAHTIHPRYELLWKELASHATGGGKRIRPRVMILAYKAFGGIDIDAILPAAAAQEVLHASLLIHDDIIDREQVRRGKLNVSGVYKETYYKKVSDPTQRRHYSDSAALLGGDLLLASSFQLLNDCPLPSDRVVAAQKILHKVIFEVAGGQLLDAEAAIMPTEDIPAELVAHYKTASYSFVGPLLIGATLARTEDIPSQLLEKFGIHLGIAYQLHDDILGIFGNEAQTGKSTTSDLREGKRTFLIEEFIRSSRPADTEHFNTLFGNPELTNKEAEHLRHLIEKSGARAKTTALATTYGQRATDIVDQLNISIESRNDFINLIETAVGQRAA